MNKPIDALVVVPSTPPAFVGELRKSIAAAGENASTLVAAPQRNEMHFKEMFWSVLAAMAGGDTLAALTTSAFKKETGGRLTDGWKVIAGCIDETNKALLCTGFGAARGRL